MDTKRTHLRSLSLTSNKLIFSGQIQLILGPMFSGKTTELLRRIQRYSIAQAKCLLIKHSKDDRYNNSLVITHDKRTISNEYIDKTTCSNLKTLCDNIQISEYECIGIDEAQFYSGLLEFCDHAANLGIVVVVAALSGDFERKAFGDVLQLIPLCEDVITLKSVCMSCYREEASFSYRINTDNKEVECVGGPEDYKALCRRCYMNHTQVLPSISKRVSNGVSNGA